MEEFYQQDGISWISPGKKDYISVKTSDGKEHRQKRLLLMNIKEANRLFQEESGIKVGLTKFSQLRPPQVQPMTARDQQVCACIYHENIDLLLSALSTSVVNELPKCSEDAFEKTVCDPISIKCIDRMCKKCGVDAFLDDIIGKSKQPDTPVSYYQWHNVDKRVAKIMV